MIVSLFGWFGKQAKWVLAVGLLCGALLPGLAQWLSHWVVPLILLITFTGVLRLSPSEMAQVFRRPGPAVIYVVLAQVAAPFVLWLALTGLGLAQTTAAIGALVVLSAPAIVSSSNIAGILGLDAALAMRVAVWTTCLVPITSLPLLYLIFGAAELGLVAQTAGRLALIILCAGGLGCLVRVYGLKNITPEGSGALDGLSALSLGIFVVALMPALNGTFVAAPVTLLGWVAFAFALNFGTQIIIRRGLMAHMAPPSGGSLALTAGNRNFALLFAALPAEETAQLLPFLAAYQLPMFLTPLLLRGLYAGHKS